MRPIKILLIEDNPADARLIEEMLKEVNSSHFELRCEERVSSGLDRIAGSNIDLILLDLGLPDSQGLSTLTRVFSQAEKIPIMVLTGFDDEETGIKAIQMGAQDYLVKGQLGSKLLVRSIRYAIERKVMEDDLRKLSSAVMQSPAIVIITDVRGNIEYVNPKFSMVTGYTQEEVLGKNPRILKSGRTTPAEYKRLWDTILSGNEWRGEFVNKKKNGELYWDSTCISPIKNPEGRITHFVAVMEDITGRKRMEEELRTLNESLEDMVMKRTELLVKANEELRRSRSKYKVLLDSLPQRIYYKDRNLVYVSCNENLARDFHIKPDEVAGKTDYDFFPKEIAEEHRARDKRVIESGRIEDKEETYVKSGHKLIIRIVRTPIRDEEGNIIGILGSFFDVTEKVILQKQAEKSRHLASLGELAAGVGHEINNPITGIINCARILWNKSKDGSKEKDIASRIMKEGERIANLTGKLLSFARPKDKEEKKSMVSIHEIMKDTLVLTETQLRNDCIKTILNIPKNLPKIMAHPQQIQQIFLNLISNARYALNQKYPQAHKNKILKISGEEITMDHHLYIKLTFYDNGTGIPADVKEKMMEPFFTTKPRGIGTGLGMTITHNIIKEHKGKLMVDSVEGEFTEVTVMLPAA